MLQPSCLPSVHHLALLPPNLPPLPGSSFLYPSLRSPSICPFIPPSQRPFVPFTVQLPPIHPPSASLSLRPSVPPSLRPSVLPSIPQSPSFCLCYSLSRFASSLPVCVFATLSLFILAAAILHLIISRLHSYLPFIPGPTFPPPSKLPSPVSLSPSPCLPPSVPSFLTSSLAPIPSLPPS